MSLGRLAEWTVFLTLAAGLHAVVFLHVPPGETGDAGAGGEASISLQAASPQIAAMVAKVDLGGPVPVAERRAPEAAPAVEAEPARASDGAGLLARASARRDRPRSVRSTPAATSTAERAVHGAAPANPAAAAAQRAVAPGSVASVVPVRTPRGAIALPPRVEAIPRDPSAVALTRADAVRETIRRATAAESDRTETAAATQVAAAPVAAAPAAAAPVAAAPAAAAPAATEPPAPKALAAMEPSPRGPATSPRPAARPAPQQRPQPQRAETSPAPPSQTAPSQTAPSQTAATRPARPAEPQTARTQSAQEPQTTQRAQGSGARAAAGTARTGTASLSSGERSSLMAQWGAKIRARVERRKPGGTGAQGTATVRLVVATDGRLTGLSLARSSGDASIDRAAVDAVRRAGRFPKAPGRLGTGTHAFNLPIRFGG